MPITHAICEIVNGLRMALVFGGELPIPGPKTSIASPLAHFDHAGCSTKSSPSVKAGKKMGSLILENVANVSAIQNSKMNAFFKTRGPKMIKLGKKGSV